MASRSSSIAVWVFAVAAAFAPIAGAGEVPFAEKPEIYDPPVGGPSGLAAADVDADGDVDLLGTTTSSDEVLWFENTNGDASNWTSHALTNNANAAHSVYAGDLDGDGDIDLASAAESDVGNVCEAYRGP